MPTKTYYLDAARTDAVTASWGWFFRDFRLDYHGQELGRTTTAQELKAGREFVLPDGRRLSVRLQQKFGAQGLDFQLDDQPVAGTVNDPHTQVSTGFAAILFIAGFNVLAALVVMAIGSEVLAQMGLGWGALVEGLLYAGLAWLGKYRLSAAAFYVALALVVLDGVFNLGSGQPTAGIVVRVFLGIAIYRAAAAARQLRAARATAPLAS